MGFFGKGQKKDLKKTKAKEGNLASPDLPSLPDLPAELPGNNFKGATSLPSLPNSQIGNKLNQESVKEAIIQKNVNQNLPDFPEVTTPPPVQVPMRSPPPRATRLPQENYHEPRSLEMTNLEPHESLRMPTQPLFIKLDTFEKAISSFNEIKLRISEIDSLLRNLKDIKNKEEAELEEWEKEIDEVKSRLEQINHDIFDKIE